MKVCTDACILGAYADVANGSPARILDIGTGTGLLALMAAQRNPLATVDAIEVDEAAFEQAMENVAASNLSERPAIDRVRVIPGRVQDFEPASSYDRILTNPPFYTNHLRSPTAAVNRALHTDELPFPELVDSVIRLLQQDGQWWVLLPPYETESLVALTTTVGLMPFQQLHVRHNDRKPVFRIITGFAHALQSLVTDTLTIHDSTDNTYTPAFRSLLRDFYLMF
ncbi:MAG: methyltransferase [Spirosoma sp.]|nr:methyltransferase [Spirosoma sp.]